MAAKTFRTRSGETITATEIETGVPIPPPRNKLPRYCPAPQGMHDAVFTVLAQCEARDRDPSAPEPDIKLLAAYPFGPLAGLEVRPDPDRGEPAIWFTVQDRMEKLRQPRCFPLRASLAILALLLPGHGMSVNENTPADPKGRRVLTFTELYGNIDKVDVFRVLVDAQEGEVVLHRSATGERPDYHNGDPYYLTKRPARELIAQGKPLRRPFRGRQHAIATSLARLQVNRHRADWTMTDGQYLDLLRRAFAVLDAAYRPTTGSGPDAA